MNRQYKICVCVDEEYAYKEMGNRDKVWIQDRINFINLQLDLIKSSCETLMLNLHIININDNSIVASWADNNNVSIEKFNHGFNSYQALNKCIDYETMKNELINIMYFNIQTHEENEKLVDKVADINNKINKDMIRMIS